MHLQRSNLWYQATQLSELFNLRRWPCDTLIQQHFDYVCSAWYSNLAKKLKNRIQTSQIEFIHLYLQLDRWRTYLIKNLTIHYPLFHLSLSTLLMINALTIWIKISKQLRKKFQTRGSFHKLNALSEKPVQVNWHCLTLVQTYGVKPLRRSSEKKYVLANQAPFITKALRKEIMKRLRWRNKFLNAKSDIDRKEYIRNSVTMLLGY